VSNALRDDTVTKVAATNTATHSIRAIIPSPPDAPSCTFFSNASSQPFLGNTMHLKKGTGCNLLIPGLDWAAETQVVASLLLRAKTHNLLVRTRVLLNSSRPRGTLCFHRAFRTWGFLQTVKKTTAA
jgi:hypothetical protein